VSDERTLEEQCYGVCYAAKERIAELEAGIAAELRRLHAVNAELLEALATLTAVVGLTPIAGNKAALQEAFDLARAAIAKAEEVQT
jgi:hypothetical protein